jgi:hypothetical protein
MVKEILREHSTTSARKRKIVACVESDLQTLPENVSDIFMETPS